MDIYDFLKAVDERNRACEMALRYAALIQILADFRDVPLIPDSRYLLFGYNFQNP